MNKYLPQVAKYTDLKFVQGYATLKVCDKPLIFSAEDLVSAMQQAYTLGKNDVALYLLPMLLNYLKEVKPEHVEVKIFTKKFRIRLTYFRAQKITSALQNNAPLYMGGQMTKDLGYLLPQAKKFNLNTDILMRMFGKY